MSDTTKLKSLAGELGVDLFGVADLKRLRGLPPGMGGDPAGLLDKFRYAIVLGAQLNKLGAKAKGADLDVFLEKAALQISAYLETKEDRALIIHPEDEIDPVKRLGLLSLKVLAKTAGLGWQGRSLLIVSPEYGPVHRWIALLTNLKLQPGEPLANQCDDCTLCIDKCPHHALKYAPFADHPAHRDDVLDITLCKGDDSCKVCLAVCPWFKSSAAGS
ncbi:MAG: 4Fe-4S dicluster domain-containing protein [Candidatus Aminicenantes bacterium]|nr:4Fe-4S dicluster domain-containing protein [Candidatus Aminicenantes bacterium]